MRPNPDGSVRSIVWRGRAASDGLATFRFLASTPEQEGEVAWKAIQTYRDGTIVRWIGSAGSETPASITTISGSAPRENAGGESAADAAPAASSVTGDDGPDWLARAIALAALLAAAAAFARRRRRRPRAR